jgi:hypothetical protein
MACKRLQAFSEREGNSSQAALFAYLTARFDPQRVLHESEDENWVWEPAIANRNGAVLQISSLLTLVIFGLMMVALALLFSAAARRARAGHGLG